MEKLQKLILTICFIVISLITFAQKAYNVGINLVERIELKTGLGGHATGSMLSNQPLTGIFFEKQEKRQTHRVSLGYLNMDHSLNIDNQQLDRMYNGDFKRSKWDIGYDFLYSFSKRKGFSIGLGVYYLQDKQISFEHGPKYYDFKNKAFASNFSMEANIKFLKTWYINPSIKWQTPFYFSSINKATTTWEEVQWQNPGFYITPIRISVKKTLFAD